MRHPSSISEGLIDSSISGGLVDRLFGSADVDREVSDAAFLRAMLDVEAALARTEADVGIVPPAAARAIANACGSASFDITQLGADAEASGNPVVPLVRALGAAVPEFARPWVHHGATSQDVVDTALMLMARRAGSVLLEHGAAAAAGCARLADLHRDTAMAARTLGQQATLTTFGLKAAGWLTALDFSVARLRQVLNTTIAVQFGGAAGTLGALGPHGPAVLSGLAERLELAEPDVPWHTDRQRVLELAAALGSVVAAVGKLALDVVLMAQTEVGEVSEGNAADGEYPHGGSSAMPHKQNPVHAVLIRSAAFRAPGLVSTMFSAAQQEGERAAGGWHAEWQSLRELLSLTGGALSRTGALVAGLDVRVERMRANVDSTGGQLMAESIANRLAINLGRGRAQALVAACCARAVDESRPLRDLLAADSDVSKLLSPADLDAALAPAAALGSVNLLIDRALAAHDRRR
jgi:3-carboxy-cis,cis-muconate cycloisomerase